MQTANPRAKIESKSYHLIFVDESQSVDEYVLNKSISPMGAFYLATLVMTGTPSTEKGVFYKTIQHNRRMELRRGRKSHISASTGSIAPSSTRTTHLRSGRIPAAGGGLR